MGEGMNRVTLLGNLGSDAELRVAGSGVAVMHLRLATNEPRWDRDAQQETPHTEWHDVVFFGARAEGLSKVLKQGDALLVEGSLRTSSYEKDGVKKYRTEVYARDVYFTGKRRTDAIRPTLPGVQSAAPADLRF
jgi:single-strand DNA-binding protein